MQGSRQRVFDMMEGRTPDRVPLYDLLRNDAVIKHFTGRDLTVENADELLFEAFPKAIDTTRRVRLPEHPSDTRLPDGRRCVTKRWTSWTEHVKYASSEEYAEVKRRELAGPWDRWTEDDQRGVEESLTAYRQKAARLGDDFFFFSGGPEIHLMGIYGEVGLEHFCYYLADCPDVIDAQLEQRTVRAEMWLEHLPEDHGIVAVFSGDDIAYKGGPLLSPAWFRENYFARFKRLIAAYHRRGIFVNFHSDGNLMPILDDLVEAGIDMLNPIETAAGMDIAEIHRRYPDLIMAGGIDVSTLLPFGTPDEVRDVTIRAIEDAEGKIMIGSSTELHNDVPLANFLALREAVLGYRL